MSWTKRQLIEEAFKEIGLAGYVYDLTPDQLQTALRRMDAMMAGWESNGVRVGYPIPNNPDTSDIDTDSNLPGFAIEAVYTNLGMRIAPMFGKTIGPETRQFADMSYNNMANQVAIPTIERQMPQTMPRGQGTKPWRNFNNPFVYAPSKDIQAGSDNNLDFE